MVKQVLVLLFTLLLALLVDSGAIKNVKTGEIIINSMDEAVAELKTLKQSLQSAIAAAENSFNIGYVDILGFSSDILRAAEIAIDEKYESAVEKLNTVRDVAYSVGVDISNCTDGREQTFDQLPDEVKDRVQFCITDFNVAAVLDEYKYYVDMTITKVNKLEFQLSLCGSSNILCFRQIITQTKQATVQLRQKIEVKVERASNLLKILKPQVEDCSYVNAADFANSVNGLVEEIETCAYEIFG